MYRGDINLGDTIDIKFTSVNSSGVPTTLSGTPSVAAYVDNGTTEITAGITLSVDFDSRTGLNNVRVVASSGNGFAGATNVQLVIIAGTVGGSSVVGYVIGAFSILNRSALRPVTAGRTLLVDSSGQVTVGSIVNGAIAAATFAANALDAVWSTATRLLTAGTNIVLAKGTGVTGFNDIAAGAAMTLTVAYDAAKTAAQASDIPTSNITAIKAKTDNLPPDPADASDIAGSFSAIASAISGLSIPSAATIAAAVWAYATRILTAGTNIVLAKGTGVTGFNDLDAGAVRTAVGLASANLDTQLDAIPTNTDLATALAGADDATLAAIAALPTPLTAAGVRTALGLASANLDTQLDAIPTNADLATALAGADDATLAAIAALNNISPAQVNAEVVDALATDTYAEPTGVPPATASLATKIGRLHQALRNKVEVTADSKTFSDDAGTALYKKTLSDDGTTYSESKAAAP